MLVVGSVALDTVETPADRADRVVGGSAVFFASSASLLADVRVVGVVGEDYPLDRLAFLAGRGVCLRGVAQAPGESFFWAGRYSAGFAARESLETRLGVFASFSPDMPAAYQDSDVVFLGNIDPALQLRVLDQIDAPALVAADTMDFWIEGARDALLEVVSRLDVLFCNDEEVRALAGEPNLAAAARWVRARGPDAVVVKKGEHGAVVFSEDWTFFVAGYPLDAVVDPTGAGDAFAGGFLGRLAAAGIGDREEWKRAAATGSAMGAFAAEAFSVDRFRDLRRVDVDARVRELARMTEFEPSPAPVRRWRRGCPDRVVSSSPTPA